MTTLANPRIPGGINIEKKRRWNRERDEMKREVCERYGIAISYFSYKDDVSRELMRNRLKDHLAN